MTPGESLVNLLSCWALMMGGSAMFAGARHVLSLLLFVEIVGLWLVSLVCLSVVHVVAGVLVLGVAEACVGLTILRGLQRTRVGSLIFWVCGQWAPESF